MTFTLPDTIIERGRRRNNNNVLQFPSNLGVHGILLIFKEYNYQSQTQEGLLSNVNPETVIKSAIMLPLPSNLTDTDSLRITATEQTLAGAGISTAASTVAGAGSLGEGLGGVISSAAATAGDFLASAFGAGSMNSDSFTRLLAFLARSQVQGALNAIGANTRDIDIGLGSVLNPRAALYFDGGILKRHTFDWVLVPSSSGESDILRQITRELKVNSLPNYTNVGPINRALLNYPSMVDMYFFGIDDDFFYKFKTCMIEAVTYNYTPQGLSVMKGGKPAAVSLSIQLIETDIHTAVDYGAIADEAIIPQSPEFGPQ